MSEAMKKEVKHLATLGEQVEMVEADQQSYVLARGRSAPSPPWEKLKYDILIVDPATYASAALDAFYIEYPYKYNGGGHGRAAGAVITVAGRQWQLVSWHYTPGKPWVPGVDNLQSHLAHCDGFFLHRGAQNAIT